MIVNYGKIQVRKKHEFIRIKIRSSYLVKAMGRVEEIRTKRERHHIMKR
jgi:hypothetical protein